MGRIKIVIGSNYDLEFLDEAQSDNNLTVFSFEPNPIIVKECLENNYIPTNYQIIQKAIHSENGEFDFYISSDEKSLMSSLKRIKNEKNILFSTINVKTITMFDFIENNDIEQIDYLHIDSQGNDYDILHSFREKINIVKEGVCESMAPGLKWTLYENQATFNDFQNFFFSNGFDISYLPNYNSGLGENEVNIFFKKSVGTNPKLVNKII